MAFPDEQLDPGRRDAVLEGLGLSSAPAVDRDGLTELYEAWCARVPFDNVRKLIALHGGAGGPLPGIDAADFFDAWLAHGTGGTCWPGANALHALLTSLGFASRRVSASMFDLGEPSHGTTIVTIEGTELLVDSSMLTGRPLPLDPSVPTVTPGTGFTHRARPVEEGWLMDFTVIALDEPLPCRTLSPDATPLTFFEERYEVSRTWSPFNTEVNMLVHRGGSAISHRGGHRFRRPAGSPITALTDDQLDDDALRSALVEEIGYSEQIIYELFHVSTPAPPRF
ncbi:MAG: arylamine N-acetyltransferase [Acidimicrobiales bacterium]